jgi:hypothetical protein
LSGAREGPFLFMNEVFFMVRHTPFWSVPLVILGLEFGYVYWLRKKKKASSIYLTLAFLGVLATSFYIWAGGPEKSVGVVKKLYRDMN